MAKRSCSMWSVMSIISLLFLTQSASADLIKIEFDFSMGLNIPVNCLTIKSITKEYWSTSEALFRPDQLEIFEQLISQIIVFDKETLALSLDVLVESFSSDINLLSTPLYETNLYTPIKDIGSDFFRESASVSSYNLFNITGKKSILDSILWH